MVFASGGRSGQACCAGYCGECSDYPTCKSVRGQDSEYACCASKVVEIQCGKGAAANVCLKSCDDAVPPCIMGEAKVPPSVVYADQDCNHAVTEWRQRAQAALKLQRMPGDACKKESAMCPLSMCMVAPGMEHCEFKNPADLVWTADGSCCPKPCQLEDACMPGTPGEPCTKEYGMCPMAGCALSPDMAHCKFKIPGDLVYTSGGYCCPKQCQLEEPCIPIKIEEPVKIEKKVKIGVEGELSK